MSQSRFWISTHPTYEAAAAAKVKALEEKPDGVFQVRRGGDSFRLVERFKSNEVAVIENSRQSKRKKRGRKNQEDFSWLTGKS